MTTYVEKMTQKKTLEERFERECCFWYWNHQEGKNGPKEDHRLAGLMGKWLEYMDYLAYTEERERDSDKI